MASDIGIDLQTMLYCTPSPSGISSLPSAHIATRVWWPSSSSGLAMAEDEVNDKAVDGTPTCCHLHIVQQLHLNVSILCNEEVVVLRLFFGG